MILLLLLGEINLEEFVRLLIMTLLKLEFIILILFIFSSSLLHFKKH